MKIKIEADLALSEMECLEAIAASLLEANTAKIMENVRPGESFQLIMGHEKGSIFIEKM